VEKSTGCCHFACKMKETEDKERVKRAGEEATVIYLTCLLKPGTQPAGGAFSRA
jgi:hypothetical protein